ncbi:hypothetical protein HDU79_007460 [Rhizoclosmatium sp. JEL0117]|nr:hypothetical protein HDU79_007460 [Rhizoclosmatium sp. JEL0117]
MFEFPQVVQLATNHGLTLLCHNETSRVAIFQYPSDISQWKVNVYYTTQTVATVINHPVKGRTQLFRRNVSWADLGKIFQNARVHTGKGYYRLSDIGSGNVKLEPFVVATIRDDDQYDEETALKKQLISLEEQTKVVKELLDVFEQKRKREAEEALRIQKEREAREESQRVERERQRRLEEEREEERIRKAERARKLKKRGSTVDWSLCYAEHIPKTMDSTKCLALSPSGGYAVISDDGDSGHHSIPDNIADVLAKQHHKNLTTFISDRTETITFKKQMERDFGAFLRGDKETLTINCP